MIDGIPYSFYLRWYIVLPLVLSHVVLPAVIFLYFCKIRGIGRSRGQWLWCGCYVALSAAIMVLERRLGLKGSPGLVLEIGLLSLCGRGAGRRGWMENFAIAVLVLSMLSVADGLISWADQRIFAPVVFSHKHLIYPSDGVREFLKVAAVTALFGGMLGRFGRVVEQGDKRVLGWTAIPMFFIALVERIIRHSIYGDSLVFDQVSGFSSIVDVDHGEMLFLQVFACVCLFLVLFACEKILDVFRDTEKMRLVRQQALAQEIYIREAAMRYKRTRSFRHDIRNHLMVLETLLDDGREDEARNYLSQLKEVSESLAWEVSTGNAAVDALLGSKLALARQEGIRVTCDIKLPDKSGIKDMDWCMILANAADNAIEACRKVDMGQRYLRLEGKRKGNFYLIFLENSCQPGGGQIPEDGIGLSGIRAVAETYGGRVENEMCQNRYRLRVLLVDSRQEITD